MQRRTLLRAAALCCGLSLVAGAILAAGNLAATGIPEPRAKDFALSGIEHGTFYVGAAAQAFFKTPAAARPALVRDALTWARAYTESSAFRAEWDKRRATAKPAGAAAAQGSADAQVDAQFAAQRKQIDEMRKSLAQLPAEMRPEMQKVIEQLEAQLKDQSKDPAARSMMKQAAEVEAKNDQERGARALAAWEAQYPADPRKAIAKQVRRFLDVSRSVDFDAKLVPCGRKKCFANPAYEQQGPEWKTCFRAGKETVAAAQEFAAAWLRDLEKP